MHAYGCVGSQYRGNEVSSARGDVGMHDLGLRVAGKFPETSCRDSFCQKKSNDKQKSHRTSTQAGVGHRSLIQCSINKHETIITKNPEQQTKFGTFKYLAKHSNSKLTLTSK